MWPLNIYFKQAILYLILFGNYWIIYHLVNNFLVSTIFTIKHLKFINKKLYYVIKYIKIIIHIILYLIRNK